MSLSDKVCLITGGNGALGKAAALEISKSGATVVLVSRNRERAETAQDEVRKKAQCGSVEFLLGDLSSQASIRESKVFSSHCQS